MGNKHVIKYTIKLDFEHNTPSKNGCLNSVDNSIKSSFKDVSTNDGSITMRHGLESTVAPKRIKCSESEELLVAFAKFDQKKEKIPRDETITIKNNI